MLPFKKKRIAICFFGITRSLSITHHSIKEKVINPANMLANVQVLCHFFNQREIQNIRTGETGQLKQHEYRLLSPERVVLHDPLILKDDPVFQEIASYGDHWDDDFSSLKNLYHQLTSLKVVTNLALSSKFDVVGFLRPDLEYHDSFLKLFFRALYLGENPAAFLPRWQTWGGGLNDRFAVCRSRSAIEAYGNRLNDAISFCVEEKRPLHSESLLRFSLDSKNIPAVNIGLRASRVRANGTYATEDFSSIRHRRLARLKAKWQNIE